MIWQFTGDRTRAEAAGQRAQRAIAVSFWLLAPYVAAESVHGLLTGHRPDPSGLGIVLAALSSVVMLLLGHAKHRLGARLGSAATAGEGTQSFLCAALAAAVLISLAVNAALGWWWLDSCAGSHGRLGRHQGGPRRLARQRLLLIQPATATAHRRA